MKYDHRKLLDFIPEQCHNERCTVLTLLALSAVLERAALAVVREAAADDEQHLIGRLDACLDSLKDDWSAFYSGVTERQEKTNRGG